MDNLDNLGKTLRDYENFNEEASKTKDFFEAKLKEDFSTIDFKKIRYCYSSLEVFNENSTSRKGIEVKHSFTFEGRTVDFHIVSKVHGGYDTYCELWMDYLTDGDVLELAKSQPQTSSKDIYVNQLAHENLTYFINKADSGFVDLIDFYRNNNSTSIKILEDNHIELFSQKDIEMFSKLVNDYSEKLFNYIELPSKKLDSITSNYYMLGGKEDPDGFLRTFFTQQKANYLENSLDKKSENLQSKKMKI